MTPTLANRLEARSCLTRMWALGERVVAALDWLRPLGQLAARAYVASVFFRSGLTKLRDWDTTLALFTDEYHVPLLNPAVAAFLGTGAELALPVLLVAGLFGRFAAAGLSVLNVIAVLSLADLPDAALQGHIFWGSLLALLLLWGPGRLSVDHFLAPRLRARSRARSFEARPLDKKLPVGRPVR
jgi:putative oxidoreductase